MKICPNCAEENSDRARFCQACASPLEAEERRHHETRKVVTVVFSDVTGSTALGERIDPESMRQIMSRYFDLVSGVIQHHGGTVEKFIGDAVMAVFGIPQLHEDDALRAVKAAAEIQHSLAALNADLESRWRVHLEIRTGVNSGEVVTGDPAKGQTLVTGDAVNVAARLEQVARPGEILIGETTHRLVRDAVKVERREPVILKGKAEPVAASRLLEVLPGAPAFSRRLDSPLVGRDRESALLRQAFDRSVTDHSCNLFTVLGPAGAGKSRLVEEFISQVQGEASTFRGRCLPYGDGITFWPIKEVVLQAAGCLEDGTGTTLQARLVSLVGKENEGTLIAQRILAATGVSDEPTTQEEIFWAVRKLFEILAARTPLLIVFDDIHSADPTFLELIEHVVDWSRDAAIQLICLARPELFETRPGWGGGMLNAASILLEPLAPAETDLLIENLLGTSGLTPTVKTRITEAAEGNPLFVEELLRMLIDDGLLSRVNARWEPVADLVHVPVPPTIQALLAARLDRLKQDERCVIEYAAVGGKVFYKGAVAELSPREIRPHLNDHLTTLLRRELVRRDQSMFAGEEAFRFRHMLIRDTAYESMSKQMRADLHERFAHWLETVAAKRITEFEEIIGHHLEQAYRYRNELGAAFDELSPLAQRAAYYLKQSALRAQARSDHPAARNLFSRAMSLLPADDSDTLAMAPSLAYSLMETGQMPVARQLVADAIDRARQLSIEQLEERNRIVLLAIDAFGTGSANTEDTRREVERLIPLFEKWEDNAGLAYCYLLLAEINLLHSHWEAMLEPLEHARTYARDAGDKALESEAHYLLAASLRFGPTPARKAFERLKELNEGASEDGRLVVRQHGSVLVAMQGRLDEARQMVGEALDRSEELGQKRAAAHLHGFAAAEIETIAGDVPAAERELRLSQELFQEMGDSGRRSTIVAQLAEVLHQQRRDDEAQEFIALCKDLSAPDDAASQMLWHSVQGMLLAGRGYVEEGAALARKAVDIGGETDQINDHAHCLVSLAEVLERAGKIDEAKRALQEAIHLFDQKGNVVLAERTQQALAEFPTNPQAASPTA